MRFTAFLILLLIPACSPPRPEQELVTGPPRFAIPHGYQHETADGRFTFVMLPPAQSDMADLPYKYKLQTEELRKKYPVSGLYRHGETVPVWEYRGAYSYDVFPSNDGIHMAVLEGDSWFTSQFVSGQRLPVEMERSQLDSPAVSFYRSGDRLKTYSVREIVGNAATLRHSPQHVQWRAGEGVVEKNGRFWMYTQDAQKVIFDLKTGELLSKESAGANAKYFLAAIASLTIVTVLLAIRWLVRGPKPERNSAETLAGAPAAP
ncbi:MAG: hypothetical protein U0798_18925 [Gemmataceae bacterium]